MNILPSLYSLASTGRPQVWTIEVEGNKYRTHSGQVGGAITTSEWTVCKAKNVGRANATTPETQAEAEAAAKWQKKLDNNHFATQKEAEESGSKFVEPMLAKDYNDYKNRLEFPVFSQPKLDGFRCIVTKDGMFSRNGKVFVGAPHIHETLKPIFELHPDIIFDGEAYSTQYSDNFDAICSIIKKAKPTAADLVFSAQNLQYHVYDLVDPTHTFSARNTKLRWFHSVFLPDSPIIKMVSTKTATNQQELDALYSWYMEEGYEGQMVRLDTHYENKRTKNLLKRKEWQDAEFAILDVVEGVGGRSGMVGNFAFAINGKPFSANVKGPHSLLKQYLDERESLIGKTATVKYFNLTPGGIPRFPCVIKVDREACE